MLKVMFTFLVLFTFNTTAFAANRKIAATTGPCDTEASFSANAFEAAAFQNAKITPIRGAKISNVETSDNTNYTYTVTEPGAGAEVLTIKYSYDTEKQVCSLHSISSNL